MTNKHSSGSETVTIRYDSSCSCSKRALKKKCLSVDAQQICLNMYNGLLSSIQDSSKGSVIKKASQLTNVEYKTLYKIIRNGVKTRKKRSDFDELFPDDSSSDCSEFAESDKNIPVMVKKSEMETSGPVMRKDLITPKLVAALDRCQLSIRNSVYILEATLEALGLNVDEYPIIKAPFQDLCFLKALKAYEEIDETISIVALKKFNQHLWYLTDEAAALALFDDDVDIETEVKIVRNFDVESISSHGKRYVPSKEELDGSLYEKHIYDFASIKGKMLFSCLKIDDSFLNADPNTWASNASFPTPKL
nr:unnamed protein product [Callosobruchus chinensis]